MTSKKTPAPGGEDLEEVVRQLLIEALGKKTPLAELGLRCSELRVLANKCRAAAARRSAATRRARTILRKSTDPMANPADIEPLSK